ncbi:UNVERIFIED_CONTAM: hypothetical protein FKN15_035073 [Acipenser sinensis]
MAEDYRKLQGWILENAGLEAKSLPIASRIMWMMDSERWEAFQREHTPSTLEEGLELVLSYLEAAINATAAQVAGPPAEEPERPQPKWEEPERPTPEREEPERPTPEREEPERPTPEREEPKCPTPEREEPEHPQPKRGESVRPQPKREESVRPQPKREESVRPQPKEREVGASTAVGPKLPAEGECLLVSPPPAEGEYLLVQPQEPEGEELQAQPPEIFWGVEGQDAGVPQQPLFMLLKAARRTPAQPPQQRKPAPPQPPSEWPASAPSPLPPPPPPAEGEYLLVPPSPLWEDCWPLPPPPAEGEYLLPPPLPGAEEQELPLLPVPPPQGVRWPDPTKRSCRPRRMGRRSGDHQPQQQFRCRRYCGRSPTKGSCRLRRRGRLRDHLPPQLFRCRTGPAGCQPCHYRGPLKPPFPARDFVLDCWVFKRGGGR